MLLGVVPGVEYLVFEAAEETEDMPCTLHDDGLVISTDSVENKAQFSLNCV